MTSKHYSADRQTREERIAQIGAGQKVASFIVDRGHKNGPEIHEISNTGIITIYNKRTHKLVTKLIARPSQIKRYFPEGKAPQYLVDLAYQHTTIHHYNY